jgi:hypothetical protein
MMDERQTCLSILSTENYIGKSLPYEEASKQNAAKKNVREKRYRRRAVD